MNSPPGSSATRTELSEASISWLLERSAVRVEELELAPGEFPDGSLYFGAITHDHPNELVGMEDL